MPLTSLKLTSLFSRKLVCKNIKTKLQNSNGKWLFYKSVLMLPRLTGHGELFTLFYFRHLLTGMSGDFSPEIVNYWCSIVNDVPLDIRPLIMPISVFFAVNIEGRIHSSCSWTFIKLSVFCTLSVVPNSSVFGDLAGSYCLFNSLNYQQSTTHSFIKMQLNGHSALIT